MSSRRVGIGPAIPLVEFGYAEECLAHLHKVQHPCPWYAHLVMACRLGPFQLMIAKKDDLKSECGPWISPSPRDLIQSEAEIFGGDFTNGGLGVDLAQSRRLPNFSFDLLDTTSISLSAILLDNVQKVPQ